MDPQKIGVSHISQRSVSVGYSEALHDDLKGFQTRWSEQIRSRNRFAPLEEKEDLSLDSLDVQDHSVGYSPNQSANLESREDVVLPPRQINVSAESSQPPVLTDVPRSSRPSRADHELTRVGHAHGRKRTPVKQEANFDVKQCISKCVHCILKAFEFFGFESTGFKTGPTEKHLYSLCQSVGPEPWSWVTVMKYKLAAFFAVHNGQDMPKKPFESVDNPNIILGGRASRFCHFLRRNQPNAWAGLVTTVKFSKKGFPRPPKPLLKKEERETVDVLFRKDAQVPTDRLVTESWADADEISELTRDRVEVLISDTSIVQQLRRTVRELFGGKEMKLDDLIRPFFPSTSANYVKTRALGGAVGHLLSIEGLFDDLKPQLHFTVNKQRRYNEHTGEWEDIPVVEADTSNLHVDFLTLYDRVLDLSHEELPFIDPVALPEALKVRVITKGPPLAGFLLKPVQKFLWSTLKEHPAFSLIGQPVDEDYLRDRLGNHINLRDDQSYLSGDYKASTNYMRSFVSNTIVDELNEIIFQSLPQKFQILKVLFKRMLTGHFMIDEDTGEVLEQTNGQLMGSIVSFPILCIANAALCRWAIEVGATRSFTLRDAPLMCNGDDCLFRTTIVGRRAWERLGPHFGLFPSYGKYFWSREFVDINSTTFEIVEPYTVEIPDKSSFHPLFGYTRFVTRWNHFRLRRYVNMGLLLGVKRSGSGHVNSSDCFGDGETIGSRAWELYRTTPLDLWPVVYREFRRNLGRALQDQKIAIPWYIPQEYGGLGLPPPPDVTEWKGKLADCTRCYYVSRGKYGDTKKFVAAASWNIHKKVLGSLPIELRKGPTSHIRAVLTDDEIANWDHLYGMMCVHQLFNSKLADLYTENPVDRNKMIIRSNERVWKKAAGLKKFDRRARLFDPWNEVRIDPPICVLPCTVSTL